MSRSKFSIIAYIIIGLGVIGFISQFFTNPLTLLKSILITLAISILVFSIIYFLFLRNRSTSSDMRKYNKAVKQSKLKYQSKSIQPNRPQIKQQLQTRRRRNKNAPHLRVIEGNKSKRRNRATF